MVVVVGVVAGEKLVGASLILPGAGADLVVSHGLVEEYLVGWVPVLALGGQMGHDVFVVDHSVYCGDLGANVTGQLLVADPGAPEIVDLHRDAWELVGEFDAVDERQSSTQAMASAQYL